VGGASGAEVAEAIAGAEIFSGRRLSGFSLTDAMSWGLVVFTSGCGNAGSGFGETVGELVANDRAGTDASEDGVVPGAAVLGMARRAMAVGGRAVRGMVATVAGGLEICGGAEA
jgi:hypothetical protein